LLTVSPTPYRLGRLRFTLSGDGGCVPALQSELAPLLAFAEQCDGAVAPLAADQSPHVVFDFVDSLPTLTGYIASRPVSALDDSIRVAYRGLEYHLSHRGGHTGSRMGSHAAARAVFARKAGRSSVGGRLHLALRQSYVGRGGPFSVTLQRARDPGYLSIDERVARAFMYDVFDYVAQIAQLSLGQSFMHASAVERHGGGTALVAWSGVGKTAALLQLITLHGFRYLSDDVALVDDSGMLWRTPKLLQLKGINVAGSDQLRSMLLSRRPLLDRLSWAQRYRRHGPLGVRRRVSAEELFGEDAVAHCAPLRRVFALERADVADFEASELPLSELCRRTAVVVMDVMDPFTFLCHAVRSGSHTPSLFPSYGQVLAETTAVLGRAFRSLPLVNVRIPLAASPAALATYLEKLIESFEAGAGTMAPAGDERRMRLLARRMGSSNSR
jgi:hypothetical protein